jgi:hypothetical protein
MLREFFQDIIDIQEVEAIVLSDNHNNNFDLWTLPNFPSINMYDITEMYLQIFSVHEQLMQATDEIIFPYEKGIVYVRNHSRFFLLIFAIKTLDISLLRLTVENNLYDLDNSKKGKKLLKKFPQSRYNYFSSMKLDEAEKIMIQNVLENKDVYGLAE